MSTLNNARDHKREIDKELDGLSRKIFIPFTEIVVLETESYIEKQNDGEYEVVAELRVRFVRKK